jgi:hypothetical protein
MEMERIITTYKFNDRNLAFGFALHGIKPMAVILGDDDRFWVCSLADAERLYRQGYEFAD